MLYLESGYFMIVITPHGDFKTIRKDVVAISVLKTKRIVLHHRKRFQVGEVTHVEHRKIPKFISRVKCNFGSWGEWIATYDVHGNELELLKD